MEREPTHVPTRINIYTPDARWHSRGYLPHLDKPGLLQSISFRLRDSLPTEVINRWKEELGLPPSGGVRVSNPQNNQAGYKPALHEKPALQEKAANEELRKRIEQYEDAGHGACYLQDPRIALLTQNALLHFDAQRYHLLEWCIMPNHVHVLFETDDMPLSEIVHSWKRFTAAKANKLLGRTGDFWMHEHHDRYIRDAEHLRSAREYIRNNPVNAGLVPTPEDWQWSSAAELPGSAGL
jgi:REP element-mobilizing transposase RayT